MTSSSGRRGAAGDATEAEAVARRLVAEYNRGSPDWVEACHAETTRWEELPILGGAGRGGGRAELRQAAENAAALFPDRRMEIIGVVAAPGRAALEVNWTATAAGPNPWAPVGEMLHFRAVLMLTVENGRVTREVDYVVPLPARAEGP